jgi:hypothetical protein
MAQRTFVIYEYETICTKYLVEVDVPDGIDSEKFVDEMETTDGWDLSDGKTVSSGVSGREVFDYDSGHLLLQY